MSPLPTELRNQLANVIKRARRESEAGATRALQALAVDRATAFGSMTLDEKALRNRLRAHGRQLGDVRERTRGTQEIRRLAHEVAYEHWHRMLFARFLAENSLLIEPESGVAISMAECEDLAREQQEDAWALAGRFAQRMLPRIFRPDDPGLAVTLAPETRQALETLLESLPTAVFTSDDALGWTYQFWQAERKDEVNASGVKIGADELPAVTQLFTEHYMVQFLFHNTIGAWRAGKVLADRTELATTAASEDELRQAVRLRAHGGYDFSYLRFIREPLEGDEEGAPSGPWRPAAGTFEGWPRTAAELRVLDPCCGSGHFLVEGFELLVRLRMEEEGLALEEAIRAVLAENLFGLEIDPRCTQIAAFNLALAAWRLAGRPIDLPPLNIACSGLAPHSTKEQWLTLAPQAAAAGGMPAESDLFETKDTLLSARIRGALSALYDLFEQAPELGSLIDPRAIEENLFQADFASVQPLLAAALERERGDAESAERAVAAQGIARAAELLAGEYTLVITNVPYLGRGAHSDALKRFADALHGEASNDLATVFLSRFFNSLSKRGTAAAVTPHNWLFLSRYRRLRERLFRDQTWNAVARLGPGAFETISGAVVDVALDVISAGKPHPNARLAGLDATKHTSPNSKAAVLRGESPPDSQTASVSVVLQATQLQNPESRLRFDVQIEPRTVAEYATYHNGIQTGDYAHFGRCFWEVEPPHRWVYQQSTTTVTSMSGGREHVLLWDGGGGEFMAFLRARFGGEAYGQWLRGLDVWGKSGIAVTAMQSLPVSIYSGTAFDNNITVLVPRDPATMPALWSYCSSADFAADVRRINPKMSVTDGSFVQVGFDAARWRRVADEQHPNGLPELTSNDPTQWLFHGHPADAERRTALQVAVSQLAGCRWPAQRDKEMPLAEPAREWLQRCSDLYPLADKDGIICLAAARGETGGADRLRRLLVVAFGSEWSAAKERELLVAAAGDSEPAVSLEEWLRDRFFEEHCKLFHHRPFIWHIWDGRRDGFHALVNYHRLAAPNGEGRRTLEALTYSYLGDWIRRQQADQRAGVEGADGRLAAALDLQGQLERILAGEPPYDLFVRWKPLDEQPIGWDPDINDGVRLNIRPFMNAQLRTGGRKGAGILRWKPHIKWTKDRGTEPQSLRPRDDFPWFWGARGDGSVEERTDFLGGPAYDGNRWNDLHYTNAAKRAARDRAGRATPS